MLEKLWMPLSCNVPTLLWKCHSQSQICGWTGVQMLAHTVGANAVTRSGSHGPLNLPILVRQTGNKIRNMMNPTIPRVIYSGFVPCLLFPVFILDCYSIFDKQSFICHITICGYMASWLKKQTQGYVCLLTDPFPLYCNNGRALLLVLDKCT